MLIVSKYIGMGTDSVIERSLTQLTRRIYCLQLSDGAAAHHEDIYVMFVIPGLRDEANGGQVKVRKIRGEPILGVEAEVVPGLPRWYEEPDAAAHALLGSIVDAAHQYASRHPAFTSSATYLDMVLERVRPDNFPAYTRTPLKMSIEATRVVYQAKFVMAPPRSLKYKHLLILQEVEKGLSSLLQSGAGREYFGVDVYEGVFSYIISTDPADTSAL